MEKGAFNDVFMSGDEYKKWVIAADKTHYDLMKEAGFLAAATTVPAAAPAAAPAAK